MSLRYKGAVISATPPTTTGGPSGTAPGMWTLDQQAAYKKAGTWPLPPPVYVEDVFSTYLYTGNGTSQSFTNGVNLASNGGLVWIKCRSNTSTNNVMVDTIRGMTLGASYILFPNTTGGQAFVSNYMRADSAGFSLGTNTNYTNVNYSSYTYSAWTFRKQANFFDIVTYTGTSSPRTVSHNLGSVPGCIIVKQYNDFGYDWKVYHTGLSNAGYSLSLNSGTSQAYTPNVWNSTPPTSTVFSLGPDPSVNLGGGSYVAYLFANNSGGFGANYTDNAITCGSYTGNGSATGPVVTLGYEPQWLLIKNISAVANWQLIDNMRGMSMTANAVLFPSTGAAETSTQLVAPSATGFQVVSTSSDVNTSGALYIYVAVRRGPMAVPTTGTSVFAPVTSTSSTGTVQTTNFPVDLQFLEDRAGSQTYWMDRLRGVNPPGVSGTTYYLSSYNSSGEAAAASGAITNSWNNTGFSTPSWYNGTNTIYESFRRAPGFFDVVCYTGTGSALAVSHNLAAVPQLMIVKNRNSSQSWRVYFVSVGVYSYMQLSSTATPTLDSGVWNNTAPTSTTFTVGTSVTTNGSGNTYVAYLFGSCPGVSKVGSYTGTGGTQTIDCGFTSGARFVMIKRADATDNWYYFDTARGMVAGTDPYLMLNSFPAEVNANNVYTTSVGFQLVSSAAGFNANGGTYVYLAIA